MLSLVGFQLRAQQKALNVRLADILALRFAGVALLIFVGALVLRPSFRSHATAHRVILTGIYGLLCLILTMVAITPAPYNYTQYFIGLYLALFFQFSFFYLRSRVALTVGVVTMGAIFFLQIAIHLLNIKDFFAGLFYMFNVVIVGHGVCTHAERVSRERYSSERALASLNDELRTANVSLGRKRTASSKSRRRIRRTRPTRCSRCASSRCSPRRPQAARSPTSSPRRRTICVSRCTRSTCSCRRRPRRSATANSLRPSGSSTNAGARP
ncbi:hypothetical protein BPUN_1511 [Candidatus Paraburkholderia kirkii]|nr:hypothetical protein BPUN_1511 [Candidatus Paraburkholderia kirkii]